MVELYKSIWPSISEWLNYQTTLDEKQRAPEEKMEVLRFRKRDVDAELRDAEFQSRKRRRVEVVKWLEDVVKKEDDVRNIREQVQNRRYFSRSRFLRQMDEKIEEVKELHNQGAGFLRGGAFIELHQDEAVKLIITELIGETTAEINLKKIWTWLGKCEIQPIGVWGMGGIGKTTVVTHIHNRLLEKKDIFGPVYWVTVSRGSSIRKLQDAIAQRIGFDLSNEEDEKIRSSLLFNQLQQRKKFVLILDDVWENYTPGGVGIPIGADGGKLIIDVCNGMGCKEIIEMEPLSPQEALHLFKNTLQPYHGLSEAKEEIAEKMVQECDGLPLAIVVVAGMMKNVDGISEWRNALRRLKSHMKGNEMEESVFKILRYSFTSLEEKHQECLLYCALFPEDCWIPRVSLIRYWIAEGLVDEIEDKTEDWLAEFDDGCATLNKLVRLCLLEKCYASDVRCVKMHDVIRDMAINISAENCRFMVKAGRNMNGHASLREWSENLERVSFMECGNLSLTSSVPNCPKLSTLFLQRSNVEEVPKALFEQMRGLKVLDLSFTGISFLPDSISDLVNLQALLLLGCFKLKHLPSLGKLKELRELDVSESGVEAVPDGIEKLVLLKRLALTDVGIKDMSVCLRRALPNLLRLQCLRLDGEAEFDVGVEELIGLRELKILALHFCKLRRTNNTSFFSLKRLFIDTCSNIEYLFTPGLVKHHLQNLQQIHVAYCSQMKDIVVAAETEEEELNEMNNPILCFPSLLKLQLGGLPKLESIWKGTITSDSLQEIKVWQCPRLKRLPISVSVHIEDGERRASTPSLKKIKGDRQWLNMVEWDTHPDIKSVFQPLFLQTEYEEIESKDVGVDHIW